MKIYRKRYIPNEVVDISKDEVLFLNDDIMITKWLPINPRDDFAYGKSYTFFKKGWKISQFLNSNNELVYWYCDIIQTHIDNDEYTLIDLLADVKVYPDGRYEILDLDELDEAFQKELITKAQFEDAKSKLNELVEIIKNGDFPLKECM